MALTDPYPAGIEDRIRSSIQHVYRVQLVPQAGAAFDLALVGDLAVAFAMDWAPHVQLSMTVKAPGDPAQLAAIDPRAYTRVLVKAGYAYSAAESYLYDLARLRVMTAEHDTGAGTLQITAWSEEYRMIEAGALAPDKAGVREYVNQAMLNVYAGTGITPVLATSIPYGHRPDLCADLDHKLGASVWGTVDELVQRAELRLWDDGLGTWHLEPKPVLAAEHAIRLRTGRSGTLTRATVKLDRARWYNGVRLQYENLTQGTAQVSTGPYAYTAVGARYFWEDRPGAPAQAVADATAEALLRVLLARGRQYDLDAFAAYWVRPGMTVPVKTGRTPYEAQIVVSVTFHPAAGTMQLVTQRPEEL